MGYGGGGGGGGGSGGSEGSGGSGYRRVGDDRTANLKVNNITSRDGKRGTDVDGIVEVNTTAHFIPPSGTTAERGSRDRAVSGGGIQPAKSNSLCYFTISTTGNAVDFGDLTDQRQSVRAVASSTRGIFLGGNDAGAPTFNTIDYITISSTGNALDFGDWVYNGGNFAGTPTDGVSNNGQTAFSNQTRGIFVGGYTRNADAASGYKGIDYLTIATKGNTTSFGETSKYFWYGANGGACATSTRGVYNLGNTPAPGISPDQTNNIEYVTIATTGNGIFFGDLTVDLSANAAVSNSTRGVWGGGQSPTVSSPSRTNIINYLTMSTLGNAQDFGDLNNVTRSLNSSCNLTRGTFNGGTTPSRIDVIDYITFSTTGNATDFGNLTAVQSHGGGCSDSHGGLA